MKNFENEPENFERFNKKNGKPKEAKYKKNKPFDRKEKRNERGKW